VKVTQILPGIGLLSREGLMQSQSLLMFLLNCLKSSWALVRLHSFDLICKFPAGHPLLSDSKFVNEVMLKTAFTFCDNPKAMIAEGSGLLLKLLFKKGLRQLSFIKPSDDERDMQLQFCRHILALITQRTQHFYQVLIKEGKTTALLHGLLSFFKGLFADFKISGNDLANIEQFHEWRQFFNELIGQCLEISKLCSGLLSNNRLQGVDGDDDATVEVDCRGHPIHSLDAAAKGGDAYEDYDNLILVGVWLAVKENGQVLYNLLRWLDLPKSDDPNDTSTFLQEQDVRGLGDSILNMLFAFKHRGAIEKAAESFSLLCHKFLSSNQAKYQEIPKEMLKQAFERIAKENHSTVLRRSAGIPPTIIAILRSEPLSNEPVLLNLSLDFLLNLARTSSDEDDSKIHALNISRFIF